MAAPPLPVCSANTPGAAAIAVPAAPVFSILRLIGSISDVSFLGGCALSGLHSLRSSLDGCALPGLHSLRSSDDDPLISQVGLCLFDRQLAKVKYRRGEDRAGRAFHQSLIQMFKRAGTTGCDYWDLNG